jgi:hypothetical protein
VKRSITRRDPKGLQIVVYVSRHFRVESMTLAQSLVNAADCKLLLDATLPDTPRLERWLP